MIQIVKSKNADSSGAEEKGIEMALKAELPQNTH
jgi:hypothetical protein